MEKVLDLVKYVHKIIKLKLVFCEQSDNIDNLVIQYFLKGVFGFLMDWLNVRKLFLKFVY